MTTKVTKRGRPHDCARVDIHVTKAPAAADTACDYGASAPPCEPGLKACTTCELIRQRLLFAHVRARIRDEAVAVRHPDFRQALGIHDAVVRNNAVDVEDECDDGVHLR